MRDSGRAENFRRREHCLLLEPLHPDLFVGDDEALGQLGVLRCHASGTMVGPAFQRLCVIK